MEPDGEDGRFKAALEVGQETGEVRGEAGDGDTHRDAGKARQASASGPHPHRAATTIQLRPSTRSRNVRDSSGT